jgi:hypothetical protein
VCISDKTARRAIRGGAPQAAWPNCLTDVYSLLQCESRQFSKSLGAKARTDAASPALSSKIHASGTSLSIGGFSTARGARLWLPTTSPSLSPQVAPQVAPPARQPTSSAKESTPLMIRQMFLRLYTCCYLCGASTPRQMWRNSYRCLPYLSSANVTRQRLASAGLLVESLRVPASCAGSLFSRPAAKMLRGAYVGAVFHAFGGKIYIHL